MLTASVAAEARFDLLHSAAAFHPDESGAKYHLNLNAQEMI
jgi:hypothetical protein